MTRPATPPITATPPALSPSPAATPAPPLPPSPRRHAPPHELVRHRVDLRADLIRLTVGRHGGPLERELAIGLTLVGGRLQLRDPEPHRGSRGNRDLAGRVSHVGVHGRPQRLARLVVARGERILNARRDRCSRSEGALRRPIADRTGRPRSLIFRRGW